MNIPDWPETRPLCLDDKLPLDNLFERLQPRVSEFTFTGLYLFRKAHTYRISRNNDCIILLGTGYDGSHYAMMPLGVHPVPTISLLVDDGYSIYGADTCFVSHLDGTETYHAKEERDSFDYLYIREELAQLPGNRFHKKKNRINYFTSRHSYTVEMFSPIHHDGCLKLLNSLSETGTFSTAFVQEQEACREAVTMAERLGLEGVVVTAEREIKAFALGERLNRNTCVCHFEKGDHFIDGIMQLVNREFCRRLFTDCSYVNREQDLGEAGLRNAKLSYHPAELIKKYRLEPCNKKIA